MSNLVPKTHKTINTENSPNKDVIDQICNKNKDKIKIIKSHN